MRKLSLYSWLFRCYWSSQLVRDWSTTQERIKHKGSWAYKKVYYISFSKKLKTRWHDDEVCYNWNTILGYICLANDIQHTPNLNKDILHITQKPLVVGNYLFCYKIHLKSGPFWSQRVSHSKIRKNYCNLHPISRYFPCVCSECVLKSTMTKRPCQIILILQFSSKIAQKPIK